MIKLLSVIRSLSVPIFSDQSSLENRKSNETQTSKSIASPARIIIFIFEVNFTANVLQTKNIESYFNKLRKVTPNDPPKEGKVVETADFGSSKNEKPEKPEKIDRREKLIIPQKADKPEKVERLPKLVPYTMDNPTDFDHWKSIINNLARKEPAPVIQPQLSKKEFETVASPSIAPLELDRQVSIPQSTIQSILLKESNEL